MRWFFDFFTPSEIKEFMRRVAKSPPGAVENGSQTCHIKGCT
jgi:hypothetical protein